MTEITGKIVNDLLSFNKSISHEWIVEAICPSPEFNDGFYTTLGTFKTKKEADEFTINLTENFKYEFLHFRCKKIGVFTNFINKENTIVLTNDKDFNKKILQNIKDNEEKKINHEKKIKILDQFEKDQSDKESLGYLASLIYKSYKQNILIEETQKSLIKLESEKISLPVLTNKEEILDYVKVLLNISNENELFETLSIFINNL